MNNIVVTRAKRSPDFEMSETHAHEEYEIYYLVSGKCRFFIHDRLYDMEKGDLAMLKSGVFHKNSGTGIDNIQKINVYLTADHMRRMFGRSSGKITSVFDTPHIISDIETAEPVRSLMKKIESETEKGDEFEEIVIESCVKELLVLLYRYTSSNIYPKGRHKSSMSEKAAHYIVENYKKNISLGDISRYVHLSPEYFSKKFKQDTGVGFREYLVKIRLRHAALLLTETAMSITDIAFSCGFNSSNYFSNTFTKAMGIPPARYRALKRETI